MVECPRTELAPGYSISTIINGCWQLTPDHGGGAGSDKKTHAIFADLFAHGFTTFDCADIYTGVEQTLGRFRRTLPDPDKMQIHTKFVPNRDELQDLKNEKIDAAIDRSLRRLGVERLDLLQYHWWTYATPGLDQLSERLVRAQQAGKIRYLGVTNFDTKHVRHIVENGGRIVSLQTQYSLLDRRPEKRMLPSAAATNIQLLPYGVLAGGFLSDKYFGAAQPANMNRSLQKYRLIIDEIGGWSNLQKLLQLLAELGRKHNTGIDAIAARWILDQPGVAAIILGTGSRSRAKENLALARLRLDDEDNESIARHLHSQPVPPGDMYDLERDFSGPHAGIIKMNLNDAK